jgi:uncharacterized protein
MIRSMYPFYAAIVSAALAQLLKPILYYLVKHEWHWRLVHESGGFPSSHSALVSALALSVGLQEKFSSTLFAIALAFAVIVVYDAANVRYYSGQNIRVTQQLVHDIQEEFNIQFIDPIYHTKMKEVLGHKWIEVVGGIILGCLVALVFWYGF